MGRKVTGASCNSGNIWISFNDERYIHNIVRQNMTIISTQNCKTNGQLWGFEQEKLIFAPKVNVKFSERFGKFFPFYPVISCRLALAF